MPINQTREHPSTVLAKDSKDNAEATATASAGSNQSRYYITGMDASYGDSATTGLLELKEGSTVIWEREIHGGVNISFDSPIAIEKETAVSAVLAASGTASELGKVNLRGYLSY